MCQKLLADPQGRWGDQPFVNGAEIFLNVTENKSSDRNSHYFRWYCLPIMSNSHFEAFEDILIHKWKLVLTASH